MIFLSYRRGDVAQITAHIYDRLVQTFQRELVFMDVHSIPLAADFTKEVLLATSNCIVMLVIIGPKWLDMKDDKGERRLDDEKDLLRQEIRTALVANKQVIPIVAELQDLPSIDSLPSDLRLLFSHQAHFFRNIVDFDRDMMRLIDAIETCGINRPPKTVFELPAHMGISAVEEGFPYSGFNRFASEAKEKIRILHTWTSYIGICGSALIKALHNGAKLEILLIDPESDAGKLRGIDSKQAIDPRIKQTLQDIADIAFASKVENLDEAIQVKYYDSLPYIPTFICDNKAIVGYYAYGARSHTSPHFIIEGLDSQVGEFVQRQFDALWDKIPETIDWQKFRR